MVCVYVHGTCVCVRVCACVCKCVLLCHLALRGRRKKNCSIVRTLQSPACYALLGCTANYTRRPLVLFRVNIDADIISIYGVIYLKYYCEGSSSGSESNQLIEQLASQPGLPGRPLSEHEILWRLFFKVISLSSFVCSLGDPIQPR